jgi:hypothetical protein
MSQNATPDEPKNLSARQERALTALLSGEGVTSTSTITKVSRQTVHRWRRSPEFMAAFNAGRNNLRIEMEMKLEIVALQAIANVERVVSEGDTGVSLVVLKGLGLLCGRQRVVGTESADEIRSDQTLMRMLDSL